LKYSALGDTGHCLEIPQTVLRFHYLVLGVTALHILLALGVAPAWWFWLPPVAPEGVTIFLKNSQIEKHKMEAVTTNTPNLLLCWCFFFACFSSIWFFHCCATAIMDSRTLDQPYFEQPSNESIKVLSV